MGTNIRALNSWIVARLPGLEMAFVLLRIFSFSLMSWMGPSSPFVFVWTLNTLAAVILSWCAILRKDKAYALLNIFWIIVGIVGAVRAISFARP